MIHWGARFSLVDIRLMAPRVERVIIKEKRFSFFKRAFIFLAESLHFNP